MRSARSTQQEQVNFTNETIPTTATATHSAFGLVAAIQVPANRIAQHLVNNAIHAGSSVISLEPLKEESQDNSNLTLSILN